MADKFNAGVPGVPLAALDAISDQNTRQVLRSLVDGWSVRNGDSGKGDSRFLTKGEIGNLVVGLVGQNFGNQLNQASAAASRINDIQHTIQELQAEIINSRLWQELGERIVVLDNSLIVEQQARIAAVQTVADNLAAEAATRLQFDNVQGSAINSLQATNDTQAIQISGLTTRMGGAESTIINLQSTTATQATALTALTTRVSGTESSITSLQTTTATQAQSLNSLSTRMSGAESSISTLNTTTANQANTLTALTTRVGTAESSITSEGTTRTNSDNALATAVNQLWSSIGDNSALVASGASGITNNVGAIATRWNQTQAAIKDATGNYISTATVRQETQAVATRAGNLEAKYTVKIDVNGYVAGYGLAVNSNTEGITSSFIIRADRFAIGSPSGGGISPHIPFIVQTNWTQLPNGRWVQPGVYIDYAMVNRLDGAYITAGLLEASQIYTGSQWIDRVSGQQILSTAMTLFRADSWAGTPVWSGVNRLYGSYHHGGVPTQNRARCGSYGGNVLVTIFASGTVDHFMTIWWRMNDGGWNPLSSVVETQDSYGAAACMAIVSLGVGPGDYFDFGVSATNWDGTPHDWGKIDIYGLSLVVSCSNL